MRYCGRCKKHPVPKDATVCHDCGFFEQMLFVALILLAVGTCMILTIGG